MGLNENINRISTTLISERQQKQKEKEQKAFLKELQEKFKIELLEILITTYNNNDPIYTQEARKIYINDTVTAYKNNDKFSIDYINNIFIPKYEKDLKSYLFLNYYNIAQKAERLAKKRTEKERQDLKQAQKEAERQANIEAYKKYINAHRVQAFVQVICTIILTIFKIVFFIFSNIGLAVLSFLGGFVGGMLKTKTRKRRF